MSYFYLGRTNDGKSLILDTDDMKTDRFTDSEVKKIKTLGVPVKNFTMNDAHIGLTCNENKYAIYFGEYESPIYRGEFPTSCRRNDIVGFDIRLVSVGIFDGYIYFGVICNCWVKYDVEVPMVMCQVVKTSVEAVAYSSCVAVYTEEPVYFSKESFYEMQKEQCFGDFPDFYVDQENLSVKITKQYLKVLGVVFKNSPSYEKLDQKLK